MYRFRIQLLIAGAAGLAAASLARGQTVLPQPEGPVIVGERKQEFKNFELEWMQAAIEFYGQARKDTQKVTGQPTLTDTDNKLRETLDLSGQAAIGHKNLLDLSFTANLGLETDWIDSDTLQLYGATNSNFINLYDISGLILGSGPVPVTLYSRREQSLQDQAFSGSVEDTLMETGVIAQIQSERAPTSFRYFHRDQSQNDQLGQVDFSVIQDQFNVQSNIRIAPSQRLDLNYTYDHIDQDQRGDSSEFDQNEGNIVHTLNFGEQDLSELRSSLHFYGQTGENSQSDVRWNELLILQHSDRLQTRYNFLYDNQSTDDNGQQTIRGDGQIRYWLFDSLIASATAGGQRFEADGATSDDLFVLGSLDYTKSVYMGRLEASGGVAYDAQRNTARGDLSILNQPHVFTDPFPIVLQGQNIVQGSITITGAQGFPTYQEGIDYTVQYFADRAQVNVIFPGGSISNGQLLLIDYDVGAEPASDIDTLGTSFSVRYTLTEGALRGLAFYTVYRTEDHQLSTADPSAFALNDFRDLLYGVEYVNSGLDIKLEQETRDSTTDPFNLTRFQAIYLRRLDRDSDLRFDLTLENIDYTLQDNTIQYTRATGEWDQRLGSELDFRIRLEYRDEQNNQLGDSTGWEQIVGLRWRRRQTTIYGSFRNAIVDATGSSTTSQTLEFGIRRAF